MADVPPPTTSTRSPAGRRPPVAGRVQLPPAERREPRIRGDERRTPRAGGVDDEPRDAVAVRGAHEERAGGVGGMGGAAARRGGRRHVRVEHRTHLHRTSDPQVEVLLVAGVVVAHDVARRQATIGGREGDAELGHAGEVGHAVRGSQAEGRPPVLPGAAGRGPAIEDDGVCAHAEAEPLQVVRDGEPGLSGTDDHDLGLCRLGGHGTTRLAPAPRRRAITGRGRTMPVHALRTGRTRPGRRGPHVRVAPRFSPIPVRCFQRCHRPSGPES
ncbi:hypothetical protein BC477_17700 [Clavibacter michiganensis subsp. michiganensis]|uniref:Uncharacterized protein n=1 Tax=Clavibacter michiganensis subsp. michiganensis TaxID=33013 RepID=A0A251XDG6_CLAMM|nr:hypothetical protein BC477_17700 [Clavibacter michiganensis subsp. michiganensis]OUE00257.1 hypothetical protein CMMCAS07_17800 [Clavibacter michiganensis subsp. michiganensis]